MSLTILDFMLPPSLDPYPLLLRPDSPGHLPKGEFNTTRGKLGCQEGQRNEFATSRYWNAIEGSSNASETFLRQSQRRRNLFHPFVRALNECSPPSAACRLARYVRLMVSSVP